MPVRIRFTKSPARLLPLLAAWCGALFTPNAEAAEQRFVFEKAEMGLPFRVTLFADDEASARAAADAAFARVAELNSVLSDYDPDSEISRLSRTSGSGKAVAVSNDLWIVLQQGDAIARRTGGAFDLTVGPLVNLWRRARRKQELPAPELIAEMRARVGFEKMRLDPQTHSVELLGAEMRLDAGSIAKAHAVDEALAVLKKRGIPRALVGGSGDMAAGDPPPGQEGWRIEVAPLDAPNAPTPEILLLANRGIATSGDVFQRVEIGGKRYSHIIDPHTGYGITDHSLVTVVARDCMSANSLTTSASVLGPERGLKLIEESADAAGRILRKPGDAIEVIASSRWKSLPRVASDAPVK